MDQMQAQRRRAFRGPVALQLSVDTTEKNPPHVQTIAKNVLDLVGRPRHVLEAGRNGILYFDDEQVSAISVSRGRVAATPAVHIEIVALNDFLSDLDLAAHALSELDTCCYRDDEMRALDSPWTVGELRRYERHLRAIFGDERYTLMLNMELGDAQHDLLRHAAISVRELAHLFGVFGLAPDLKQLHVGALSEQAVSMACSNPFRIPLAELPQRAGDSIAYKKHVAERLRALRDHYVSLFDPLRIPVALQVVVKPPPASQRRGKHDLDNVVRDYIVPAVLELFEPPSSFAQVVDPSGMHMHAPAFYHPMLSHMPKSTPSASVGVTRYEAYRVPRDGQDTSPGFVCVAVVPDVALGSGLLSRVDRPIIEWEDQVS